MDEPVGKYWRSNYGTKLTIGNITESDEGDFICRASNSQGVREHGLHISVEAKPEFRNTIDGPYNINVTEGESVTFNCTPSAKPEAKIVWLRNGEPISTDNPPERFVFSNDNRSLTIRDVYRDCVDRESKTDLTVIQCNASNVHGYALAQGYLNILMKTGLMIKGSKQVSVDFLEQNHFVFQCIATSDPSTPTTVRWYKTEPYNDLVRNELPYVFVDNEFLVIMVYPNCSSECAKYLGEYRCVGDDGYSQENQTIALNYQFMPPTETVRMQKEENWALWKTIMCAGAFGILLFLIGLFAGLRSKRRLGGLKRRIFNREAPNSFTRNDHEEYDSVDLPLRTVEETGESMPGECSHGGYDSIDQVLRDVAQREGSLPNLPDAHDQNKYETICPRQNETVCTERSMLGQDDMNGDEGYTIPYEEVTNGEKIGEGTVSGDQRYPVVFEDVVKDGKIDGQHAHGYESVKNGSERFPKSDDRSEEPTHRYSDMIPGDVYPSFYSGKLDSKEGHSYLVLSADKVNPCFDPSSKESHSYLDLIVEDMDQSTDLGSFDLGRKELDPQSDLGLKETNPYSKIVSDMGSKKENFYSEINSKK